MHLLHQALDSDSFLQDVLRTLSERIAGNPLKHAIVLDLNPFWLSHYRAAEAGLSEESAEYWYGRRFPTAGGYIDLSRKFKASIAPTETVFGNRNNPDSPYWLRIFALPSHDQGSVGLRRQLADAARETAIATSVETQEPAQLLAAPGDRINAGTSNPGTLGGFFKDFRSGQIYGVTCGHVVPAASASMGGASHTSAFASPPVSLPAGVVCTTSCGHVTKIDIALLDMAGMAVSNVATTTVKILSPGDLLTMQGASSGARRYEVGGAVVEHCIGGACWDRLTLFHAPIGGTVLPVGVSVALTPPPVKGDSGAWLIRNGSEWAGMVVAANALHGYAVAGDTLLSETSAGFGVQLDLA